LPEGNQRIIRIFANIKRFNMIATFQAEDRSIWRKWLESNFQTQREVWLIFPYKLSGIKSVSYNDAVEEALCFGWIDSTVRSYTETSTIQRYSVRNPSSTYSQLNKERIAWLYKKNLIHPLVVDSIKNITNQEYTFPADILNELKKDPVMWENYCLFSDSYKRIRLAYIEAARNRPEEFNKRLNHFIKKTKANKLIIARGSDKYY
jgi:uncharacterized protein YdeI (YjbR/CyaY-like superfamily)